VFGAAIVITRPNSKKPN